MASSYNLTPEKKLRLKKEVLAEISKNEKLFIKPKNKKITPAVRKNAQPAPIKIVEEKPKTKPIVNKKAMKTDISKEIIKKETKQVIKPKIDEVKATSKHAPRKKTSIKKSTAIKKKPTPKPKIERKLTPAPSPVTKKKTRTPEDRAKERELFFRPDSSVRPSISSLRISKPKLKIGNLKMFILGAAVFLILGLVAALGVDVFGIYKLGWNGVVSQKVINVLPLPAGSVDGRTISLANYYKDLSIVKSVLELNDNATAVNSDKTKEQIFNRLVSVNIIENELKKYGQSITPEQLDTEMQSVIKQIGSESKAIEDIKSTYGMDLATFKQNVLMPILAVDVLGKIIIDDESLDVTKEALKNANDALAISQQSDADFKTLVLQYSNDSSNLNQNGDIGWYSQGELPAELESALFSLNDGEVYNQVVRDDWGYHIYQVESKLIDEDSGKQSIKLNQILITVDTELYIKSLFDNTVIKRYI